MRLLLAALAATALLAPCGVMRLMRWVFAPHLVGFLAGIADGRIARGSGVTVPVCASLHAL
jgi:hypothetical protein